MLTPLGSMRGCAGTAKPENRRSDYKLMANARGMCVIGKERIFMKPKGNVLMYSCVIPA